MTTPTLLRGSCHCGKLAIEFSTAVEPAAFTPRACDCSFCMKHGAAYISDPNGSLALKTLGSDSISEYRQGSESARFLLCRHCGVLVAVAFEGDTGSYATVNARCMDDALAFGEPQTVSPQKLSSAEKRRRWAKLWTPLVRTAPPDKTATLAD